MNKRGRIYLILLPHLSPASRGLFFVYFSRGFSSAVNTKHPDMIRTLIGVLMLNQAASNQKPFM